MEEVPTTRLFELYGELKQMNTEERLAKAKEVLEEADGLVDAFRQGVAAADEFFSTRGSGSEAFRPNAPPVPDRIGGLDSTHALARHLIDMGGKEWVVSEDATLNFFYLDREVITTRLPGARLAGGKSTKDGPSIDLLLANAQTRLPIVAEVKLTRLGGGTDKDPFFALIQALAGAAYLIPRDQLSRLHHQLHDPDGRLDPEATQLDVYLLIGRPHDRSIPWNDLRARTEELAERIAPGIADLIPRIAGLELHWDEQAKPGEALSIKRWFG
jgi:hypothetical protein